MSLLTLVQSFCRNHTLAIPTAVINSTNSTVLQIYGLLSELLEEIVSESNFTILTYEATFTSVAAEDQGLLTTLAPNGFRDILQNTLYDRTNWLPLVGPLSAEDWQALHATAITTARYAYRIKQGHFYLYPAPSVGSEPDISFEYMSSYIVFSSGGTPKAALTDDADTFALPEYILRRGLTWKWKHTKGLPSTDDQNKFYELLNNYIAKDGTKETINVGREGGNLVPNILVPTANWNI